jgi:Protein of unknown function (DUF3768)
MGLQEDDDIVGDIGAVPTCRTCGSERVARDAWACWNRETGLWELETVFDQEYCHQCEGETHFVWKRVDPVPCLRIRELNDKFRKDGFKNGGVMASRGIAAFGPWAVAAMMWVIQGYDAFDDANDPWGEHDFGKIETNNEPICWKIDNYALDRVSQSRNPANEGLTYRVLTIMLASEY